MIPTDKLPFTEPPRERGSDLLRISDIGCGVTRRALLGLEPGSRIWLMVEGEMLLFERLVDDDRGESRRVLAPVGDNVETWYRLCRQLSPIVMEIDFVERPSDKGCSADRWIN